MFSALCLCIGAKAVEIERMDPPFWYTGMKNTELQVMFYGKNIASAGFTLADYEGVRVKEICKVENPNYLFVYLDVTSAAKPGVLQFSFTEGRNSSRNSSSGRET